MSRLQTTNSSGRDRELLHADGLVLSEQSAASIVYPLADALGSVRAISDPAGAVTGTAAFDAFGATTAQTGATSRFGFIGEMSDAAGIYLRARTLDPATGLFLSTDPVRPGASGVVGYNQYSYVGNNPTTSTDPTGMLLAEGALLQGQAVRTAPPAIAVGVGIRLILVRMALLLLAAGTVCLLVCDVFYPRSCRRPPSPGPNVDVDELLGARRAPSAAARTACSGIIGKRSARLTSNTWCCRHHRPHVGDLWSGRRVPMLLHQIGGPPPSRLRCPIPTIVSAVSSRVWSDPSAGPPGSRRGPGELAHWSVDRAVSSRRARPGPRCAEEPYYATAPAGRALTSPGLPSVPAGRREPSSRRFFDDADPEGCAGAPCSPSPAGDATTGMPRGGGRSPDGSETLMRRAGHI
jgi:RHS repeat-associated protein